jgi:hypothetical protein
MAFDFAAIGPEAGAIGVDAPRAAASIPTCFSPSVLMQKNKEHVLHAQQLLADISGAPSVWLPRREVVTDWLKQFIVRAALPSFVLGDTEAEDLTALDQFLRKKKIPVA